jgi:feruloyl esterase
LRSKYGFAVLSTDTGHNSTVYNSTWAYNNPEAQNNWGYRALHDSVLLGKQLTADFYHRNISYSYYSGCSTGGRQGLVEVELFPDDFDGVVVGAAAWWMTRIALYFIETALPNLPQDAPTAIPYEMWAVIGEEILTQCDPQDGLVDTIIMDPTRCSFRPETLLCAASATDTSSCLTSLQIDSFYHSYNDWVEANQTFISPHFWLGSEEQDASILSPGNEPSVLGTGYVQYFMGLGPDWNYTEFNPSLVGLSEKLNPGNATPGDFDISPFYAKGGKLIQYHGMSDGTIPTGSSVYFYDHVLRAIEPQGIDLDDFYRLFLVPGMGHCAGTSPSMNAPWYFAGADQPQVLGPDIYSVPGYSDAQHDILLAIMAWVEDGTAPEKIIATKYVNESVEAGVGRQRPMCVYPKQAFYNGFGDPDLQESWECKSLY